MSLYRIQLGRIGTRPRSMQRIIYSRDFNLGCIRLLGKLVGTQTIDILHSPRDPERVDGRSWSIDKASLNFRVLVQRKTLCQETVTRYAYSI